jgi:hypothetical protein
VGVLLALRGLRHAAEQIRQANVVAEDSRRIAQGEFLLHLDEILRNHIDVHTNLRPRGRWSGDEGPTSAEDWVAVDSQIISIAIFERLYGYRLDNIVRNPVIYEEKLVKNAAGWRDFLALKQQLDEYRKTRSGMGAG